MRKFIVFIFAFSLLFVNAAFADGKGYELQFTQNRSDVFTMDIRLDRYQVDIINVDGEMYSKVNFPGDVHLEKQGWADLPYFGIPVQLSSDRNVDVEIVASGYVDIQLVHPMLPSRGVIYRNQNPDEIPYETDTASIVDEWYPESTTEAGDPYIIRKVRGENIMIYPFKYNAVTQTLRVYENLTVRVSENHEDPVNPLPGNMGAVNREMSPVYQSLFVNYNQNPLRWDEEIGEFGDILVIYTSRDASVIQPWIEWKQQKGYHVDELEVSTGTNVASDIQSAYNANNNLLYVLLIGDWADIKSDLGPDSAPTDPMMGCVVGTDDHHDIIIGRFSAGSTGDVTAQVDKTIVYERDATVGSTWYKNALGIASDEGAGDDGEYDYDQINNIHDGRLLPTTYTNCYEEFDPGASATDVQNYITSGVSVINYCGHGGHEYWVSSGYSASNASNSSNTGKYYYAFSVACVVGEFHTGADCLAEGMLRKADGGAVATWMSTINQPWTPPMRGQDYANDLLIQGYDYSIGSGTVTTYGRTTFGSITFNAAELMVSESSASSDWDTYKTWTVFGDPSVQVRTDEPNEITLTNMSVTPGTYTTQVQVDGSGFEGALVSLWQAGSQPASAITDASGNVSIDHSFTGTVKLTVTGFNLASYHADHIVAVPDPPVCDFSADQTTITAGESVQFTDISTNYPSTWNWTFPGGTPSSSTDQNPLVVYNTPGVYDVTLYVENAVGNDSEAKTAYITVNPVTEVPVSDFTADVTTVNIGGTVNFTDLSTNQPDSWSWSFDGGTPTSSTDQNPSVVYNTPGVYTVVLTAGNSIGTGSAETKVDYITVALPDYCEAGSSDAAYEYLSGIILGTIDNTSSSGNYTDFSDVTTDAYAGDELDFTATISNAYNSDYVLVWADWNRDGDFEDSSEDVYVSSTGQGPHSTTITVPAGTTVGPVRVRIRLEDSSYGAVEDPCGFSSYGEVEDYTINVLSSVVPPVASFSGSPLNSCDGIVQFTDVSTDAESWNWNFGDGGTSTNQNPEHTYTSSGTYTVSLTVSNPGGSDTETLTDYITVDIPDATIDALSDVCETGSAVSLSAATSGGTWSGTGVSGNTFDPSVGGGDYTITYEVTIGTCTDSDTETIHVDAMPEPVITAVDPLCVDGETITLSADASGGTWSGNGVTADQFNPSTAGTGSHIISYTVSDGECTATVDISIVVGEAPDINVVTTPASSVSAADGSATANAAGGLTPYTYVWSNGDNDEIMDNVQSGTYSLTVTDAAGCETVVDNVVVDFTDGIENKAVAYGVFPNPAGSEVFVMLENMKAERIELLNILGQTLFSVNPGSDLIRIDLSSCESGVYFIRICSAGDQYTEKLMIE